MKRLLAALLVLVTGPALALSPPFILTTGVDDVGDFVSLSESTTFGPSGTIYDYSTRIAAPSYIGPPPALNTYGSTTDLSAEACDASTWTDLTTALGSGNKAILLPESCKLEAVSSDGSDQLVTINVDDVQIYCADPDACGIDQTFPSAPGYIGEYRMHVFAIGTTGQKTVQTCQFDPPTFGSKVVQVTGCTMSTTTGNVWGPGDIVRLSTTDIPGLGNESNGLNYVTRIGCFYDNAGDRFPAPEDPVNAAEEALCDELPGSGNNLVQLIDPPPVDYNPAAYHWGQNVGVTFRNCTGSPCSSNAYDDLYEETDGHTFQQVERIGSTRCVFPDAPGVCGYGTATTNVAENVWFSGLGWDTRPRIGGGVTRWVNAFGGGHYRDVFRGVGRVAMLTMGGVGPYKEASSVSLHSTVWLETGGNIKSAATILNIDKTAIPTRIRIQSTAADCYDPGPPISDDCGWGSGDPLVVFDDAVAEPLFAGKHFLHTRVGTDPWNAGSPPYIEIDITGFDGSAGGYDIDATAGGYVVWYDSFGGATYYTNANTSNIQVINNSFRNPLQHAITQGCAGCVYAYNYTRHEGDEERRGRGPFSHGNLGQGGNLYEGNDSDQAIITLDSSNRVPAGNGEGTNIVIFKNRRVTGETTTWPTGTATGTDYGTVYMAGHQSFTAQWGASNEDWSVFLNSAQGSLFPNNIDHCDNMDGDWAAGEDVNGCIEPYTMKDASIHHNKCGSCDLDAAHHSLNPTTITDIDDNENGENESGLESAWSAFVGLEPTSMFFEETPEFFTGAVGECELGKIGAYYDNFSGSPCKIPAQFLYEAHTP